MLDHFSSSIKNMYSAWSYFIENGNPGPYKVRKTIYDSWIRSKEYGIDPYNNTRMVISKEEINQLIEISEEIMSIVRPYLNRLYQFVQGSGFYIIFANADGYILELVGDEEIIHKAETTKLMRGANRSERTSGTNAIGTCLAINEPIQICAEEHYFSGHHLFTCSAAPIHHHEGQVIGCLNITGERNAVHSHTLGMVVAAVDGIEKELKMRAAYNEITRVNNQLNTTLRTISDGVLLLDNSGTILQVNLQAADLLHRDINEIEDQPIDSIIPIKDYLDYVSISNNKISDREISFDVDGEHLHYAIDVTTVINNSNETEGFLITLKSIKSVHKLITKMTAYNAEFTFELIIGDSPKIHESIEVAKIASKSDSNVLLLGQSGTGKELFAQAIHNDSEYQKGPFIAINCAALPRGLIESELYGYEGGSFTGSKKEGHPGKFELADGGTLFLDEIGDMPIEVQATLLRVLENKEVIRVGGKSPKKVDVRIIAATNKNLEEEIINKNFREDLFYRLNVFYINIPSLIERRQDIPILANYFLSKQKVSIKRRIIGIENEALTAMLNYSWPGNVRELENVIERAANITNSRMIELNDLPNKIQSLVDQNIMPEKNTDTHDYKSLKNIEKKHIERHLENYHGNVSKTANALNVPRRTLYRRLDEFGIDPSVYRII